MRHFFLAVILLAAASWQIGHAATAAGAVNPTQAGAWSGGTIIWSGNSATNINQFAANWGNGMIDGAPNHIYGANWVTKTVGASKSTAIFTGDTGGAQGPNGIYYVYYASYNNGTQFTHVVSSIFPGKQGSPNANLKFTAGKFVQNDQFAVFL